MARPFSLRDLALVHRLSEQGSLLHAETALTKQWQPLWGALQSLFGSGDELTYVWRADKQVGAGFVQLRLSDVNSHAQLIFLGATPAETNKAAYQEGQPLSQATGSLNETVWLNLLDSVMSQIGRRGVHSLVAEVDENGPELVLLRRAGFAVYTRQDIWVSTQAPAGDTPRLLEPYHPEDDWEMALIYAHIVPPLIQIVEPAPPDTGMIWVLREGADELSAFVHIHDGSGASWLRFFIHPNAQEQINNIVRAALFIFPPRPDHPVYCCVRRYQSWLDAALRETGFTLWSSQAVMVRHTLHPIRKTQPTLSSIWQTQGVPGVPTPPARYLNLPDKHVSLKKVKRTRKLSGNGIR